MKKIIAILSILFMGQLIAACSGGDKAPEKSNQQSRATTVKRMSEDAHLSASATVTDKGRALVTGTTNLPDGAQLLVTVSNEATGFTAQDDAIVRNGQFRAGPLGRMSGLADGNYTIDVTMSVSSTQPKNVQAAIGENGQYLSGPLVEDSSWGGQWIDYSFPYRIGSKKSISRANVAHTQLISNVRSTIKALVKQGHAMEKYRNTDNLSALKTCGIKMRKNQTIANNIRDKAKTLSSKYINLKVAATQVWSCVSCSNDAIKSCKQVSDSLAK